MGLEGSWWKAGLPPFAARARRAAIAERLEEEAAEGPPMEEPCAPPLKGWRILELLLLPDAGVLAERESPLRPPVLYVAPLAVLDAAAPDTVCCWAEEVKPAGAPVWKKVWRKLAGC